MAEETRTAPARLKLRLVTYERQLLDVECDEVTLPGRLGYFGVLPGHTPFISTLTVGELTYRVGRIEHYLALAWGFCEVADDVVTVLTECAEHAADIDLAAAEVEAREAEEALRTASVEGFARAQGRLEKALVRIEVARRAR